jgi:hypothetical protein
MSSVLAAAADGSPLRSSGHDNLGTLILVEALYESINTGAAVRVPSVLGR